MDHPCHKCSQPIEDGVPFCAHCGAPQIRVTMAASPTQPAAVDDAALVPGILPDQVSLHGSTSLPDMPPARSSHALQSCVLAAGASMLLTLVGLNLFVGALSAGFLTVTLYLRRSGLAIRPGAAAKLGVLGGLFFFAMFSVLVALAIVVLHKGAEIRTGMLAGIQQASVRYPAADFQPLLDSLKSPNGFTFLMVGFLILGLLTFLFLGGVGGALSAVFLGRRDRK